MTLERGEPEEIELVLDEATLPGYLEVPSGAEGLVVFAQASSSSPDSSRNGLVAEAIRKRGLGTLVFNLLTGDEDQARENRYDIPLLTDRLGEVVDWLRGRDDSESLELGLFGSSTGAAGALRAAVDRPDRVQAVVARSGRVDLAEEVLADVRAPSLFVVGGEDAKLLGRNRDAINRMTCQTDLRIVEGADRAFEAPGELEEVARVAADWFVTHLSPQRAD